MLKVMLGQGLFITVVDTMSMRVSLNNYALVWEVIK